MAPSSRCLKGSPTELLVFPKHFLLQDCSPFINSSSIFSGAQAPTPLAAWIPVSPISHLEIPVAPPHSTPGIWPFLPGATLVWATTTTLYYDSQGDPFKTTRQTCHSSAHPSRVPQVPPSKIRNPAPSRCVLWSAAPPPSNPGSHVTSLMRCNLTIY